ncbi:MAG: CNNM domain-containing protein [Pirellulaceae bacterium]
MFIALILILGLALSAFFSGSETGFYRVTRVRLIMDAKSGSLISKGLLWLVSHSTVVVATVLIGNNIANYLVSLGLVMASQTLLSNWGEQVQTFVPVLMTPVLFIYGELLPKYLFYHVPYRLLRATAPLMMLCTAVFLPVSSVVLAIEGIWARLTGTAVGPPAERLERQDLQRALLEGQEAGVVRPVQRELVQNLFTYGTRPVRQFALPVRAIPLVAPEAGKEEILERAERMNQRLVGIMDGKRLVGCYHVSDVLLSVGDQRPPMTAVCEVLATDSNIQVLTKLQSRQSPLAYVVDGQGRLLGIALRERLSVLLLAEQQ